MCSNSITMIQRTVYLLIGFLILSVEDVSTFHGLPGYTYSYNWSASVDVGIPQLTEKQSYRALSASIEITQLKSKIISFKVKNLFISDTDEAVYPWASPIILPLVHGKQNLVTGDADFSFAVSRNDGGTNILFPAAGEKLSESWKENLCRGIASLFITQRPVQGLGFVEFTVQEDSVSGTCATTYLVLPSTDSEVMERQELSFCPKGDLFEVTRTKNFDRCSKMLYYNSIAPPGYRCDPGTSNCEGNFLRSSTAKYTICSEESSSFPLDVTSYNPVSLSPWGARTEKLSAVTRQQASLNNVSKRNKDFAENLFGLNDDANDGLPKNIQSPLEFKWEVFPSKQLIESLENYLRKIFNPDERKDAIDSFRELVGKLSHCKKEDLDQIMKLREEIKETKVLRSALFYGLVSSGSKSTVLYLADLLESGGLTTAEGNFFISNLVMNMKLPNKPLLGRLVDLLESAAVEKSPSLRRTALTSISSLIRMTCVSPYHAATRFPVKMYGPFCNSSDPLISRLVAIARRRLQGGPDVSDKIAALTSLTTLGHEATIPAIEEFLSSKDGEEPELRTRAVLAFHRLAHANHPKAVHILYGVFSSYEERGQVRMGAVTLFLLSNPPVHKWFQMAQMTWHEPDGAVASFIYTSFRSMSKLESPLPLLSSLREKATAALRLTKPFVDDRNMNWIWSHYISDAKLGTYVRSELFSTPGETTNLYSRLNWNIGEFDFDAFEVETSIPSIGSAKDLWSSLFGGRKGNREIYIHATFMESIERVFTATFEELGNIVKGPIKIEDWISFQPMVRVLMEFPNDLGLLTRYEATVDLLVSSRGMQADVKRTGMTIKGNWDVDARADIKASARIGFLLAENDLATGSEIDASLAVSAVGRLDFDVLKPNVANFKFNQFRGRLKFFQTPFVSSKGEKYPLRESSRKGNENPFNVLGLHSRIFSSGYENLGVFEELRSHSLLSIFNFAFLIPRTLRERTFELASDLRSPLELNVINIQEKNSTRFELVSDSTEANETRAGKTRDHVCLEVASDFSLTFGSSDATCRGNKAFTQVPTDLVSWILGILTRRDP